MKRDLIVLALGVLLITGCLMPVANCITQTQEELINNDAEHVIKPMVALFSESAIQAAKTEVEPMIDINEAWALEEQRTEAETPLVTCMRNGLREMGYDKDRRTFYCTLGNDWQEGQPWPELELYVNGAENSGEEASLRVCWIDDYLYDDCAEAVRKGYSYELFAYTDTEYEYFNLVFTGLPIVSVHVQDDIEIGDEYTPACISISSGEEELTTVEMAKIHLRGNHRSHPKIGYRLEFQELSQTGRIRRKDVSVLGMEADSDWLLLCNVQDASAIRNYLSFETWKEWNEPEYALNMLDSRLVEVFVEDSYRGIYQLIQRVDAEKQIEKAGGGFRPLIAWFGREAMRAADL